MKLPKFDLKNVIIVGLCVLIILLGFQYLKNQSTHKDDILTEQKLRNALSDTLKIYQNKQNEWVAEKLTIQAEIKDLNDKNLVLTESQKDLIKRVTESNKQNQVITAALIDMGVKLDGLINNKPVFQNDSTIKFASAPKDSTINYEIKVHNVKQFGNIKPSLEFTRFSVPNKQFISFNWKDNKKEGYPISFTVTNTNPYYKVYNIDSYAIPELDKTKIKPTFWNKLGKFSKTWGGRAVFLGAGFLIGASIVN